MWSFFRRFFTILTTVGALSVARADQTIYTDSLQNGWQDWGWATLNYNNASPVHSGTKSVSVTIVDTSSQAIYIAHPAFDSSPYATLTFWINGGASGGQQLLVQGHAGGVAQASTNLPPLAANTWQQFSISLATLGVANRSDMDGFWIQDRLGAVQPTFYVDDISLVTAAPPAVGVTLTTPTNGAIYLAPANIPFSATVTPNGHSIGKVQFYNGATLLGEDASSPYAFTWGSVGAGSYSVFARVVYDGTNTWDSVHSSLTVVTNLAVNLTVDAAQGQHPISPLIYGVAFATPPQLTDLNAPLNRSGGNTETRYNWQINAHNHGADWYFESLDDGNSTPGQSADQFVTDSKNGGAQPALTVPMIGWLAKLGPGRARLASYAITNYGLQAANDWQWFAQAGNGVITNTSIQITTNNPNDASIFTNSTFQQAWIQHLISRWGNSTNGGVRYYLMDNEHTIWHSTHRDVHPIGTTMQEIRDKMFDYAGVVKSLDPNTIVLGPEEWGWPGYLYSGFDWQWAGNHGDYNAAHFPDRSTNGGWDYGPWLLDQFRQREITTGKRLLDYFTYHIYPQQGEFGNDVSTSMQLTRNRSTRQLWDTNYVDPSWINNIIKLIPRMKSWVATYYPGTKIGITEYNWGAEGHINGATAQADIYGIFGREGLDLATRWTTPATGSPTYNAMKMYRNYDGAKHGFGDTSILVNGVTNSDNVSSFAALRSFDGAMTVMVVNKQLSSGAALNIGLNNFTASGSAQVWQLTSANTISHLSDIALSGNAITNLVPPQSITLYIVPQGTVQPPNLRPGKMSAANTFDFWLDGQSGQKYIIQATTDFMSWLPIQTNTLASNSIHIVLSSSIPYRFFRGQWTP
jgi:Glycoside hydrolase family 44/Bacterial Ig domain